MKGIDFKRSRGKDSQSRLLVGWRKKDWRPIWYSPIQNIMDTDGGADLALFKFECGSDSYREPKQGEVNWIPFFDPKLHESGYIREQKTLQSQTLNDAWRYLDERDEETLVEMEKVFDDPQTSRQYAWFTAARAFKKRDKRNRKAIRNQRENIVLESGLALEDVELNSDDSDDSGFDGGESRSDGRDKPPKPDPKRKAGGDGWGDRGTKKPRSSRQEDEEQEEAELTMSGALPAEDVGSSLFVTDTEDNGDGGSQENSNGSRNSWSTVELDNEDTDLPLPEVDNSADGDAA